MSDVIRATDVRRSYGIGPGEVAALRGAELTIERGEMIALTGPSGSGKTTLLNCLLGLDQPSQGRVDVFGTNVTSLTYEQAVEWRRSSVAIIFQATGLLPHLSATENVDVVLRMRGIGRDERAERIAATFTQLDIADFSDHRPGELSGGQRQRVSIARALATQPELLVADEPTAELDTGTTMRVLAEMRRAAQSAGTTMLIATHDRDVEAIGDRTLRMVDGVVTP